MKLVLILLVFVVSNGIETVSNNDKQYHSYIKQITEKMTEVKSKHGKRIAELKNRMNNLQNELNKKKQMMANEINKMKEQVVELRVAEKETKKAKINLKQMANQIYKLKNKAQKAASEPDKRVSQTIISQLRKKKVSYENILLSMKEKYTKAEGILKLMKKNQRRIMNQLFRLKHRMFRVEEKIRRENDNTKRLLAQKKKLLKEANQLASDKKRFAQQKSILESKVVVLKEQMQNATKQHLPKLQSQMEQFKERISFLGESVKDVIEREEELFVDSPKLSAAKQEFYSKLNQLKQDRSNLLQQIKDARYELKQMKGKLNQSKTKKVSQGIIREQKNLVNEAKEKVIEIKRKLAEIRRKKDVVVSTFKAEEKQYYENKRIKAEKKAFKRLSDNVKELQRVFNRIIRIKNAMRTNTSEKLKQRLIIVNGHKKELLIKIKVLENRLLNYQKVRQQQFKVQRVEMRMKKERINKILNELYKKIAIKKTLLDMSKESQKLINAKEYFLSVDRANDLEKKIARINTISNNLQVKEVNMLKSVIKRMKVIVNIIGIKQASFEEELAGDMAEFHKIIDAFIVSKYNLDMQTRENEQQAQKLSGK
ncbi:hypothetical protein ENU1_148340 [Entamoeba nuttalli P19]|uniref:Uncharacterized protein n=2 Tax=Entamoeba nuttalli TaxID=412467 RepID=K2G8Z3_ENTNP|nr:hypothetical protein ENU1_148340 [Entamoeba nuttalli P19]EKE38916.1 hypothetical protein ENU1_148340 [Entamoeba nuttalli P19]|eukprot:XP_008858765.1 hypothetical protein ENU1_148340 [Entamoeba nuttalli P19]